MEEVLAAVCGRRRVSVSVVNAEAAACGTEGVRAFARSPAVADEARRLAHLPSASFDINHEHSALWDVLHPESSIRKAVLVQGPTLDLFAAVQQPGVLEAYNDSRAGNGHGAGRAASWEVGMTGILLDAALQLRTDLVALEASSSVAVAMPSVPSMDTPTAGGEGVCVAGDGDELADGSSIFAFTPSPEARPVGMRTPLRAARQTPGQFHTPGRKPTPGRSPGESPARSRINVKPQVRGAIRLASAWRVPPPSPDAIRILNTPEKARPLAGPLARVLDDAAALSPIGAASPLGGGGEHYVSMESSPMLDSREYAEAPLPRGTPVSTPLSATTSLALHYLTKAWKFMAKLPAGSRPLGKALTPLAPFVGSDGTVFRGLLLTWTPRVFEAMAAAQECKDAALVDLVRSQLEGQATVVATVGEAGKLFVASAPIHDVANPLEDSPARGRLPGYGLRVRLRPGLGLGTGNEHGASCCGAT
ncbi:uncharacterized protein AMSG_10571 [Thecamonas trahens ATCC 50062]|uniref:Uncharacterized protein n=1 Tax=Thecamonas trahens ATCC 50062 TaxID=461836 RepID=A0A0L0DRN1_THETB|nr:hypothetical protein AMSG_10571 [Thecamonas trahens ATCC 50062]KNC54912.1 hypothetical protein AMSG_10571 [Thecamonas trahens ATCC 50062]|eukprot:XP_013753502.1 hypothetical protein AMSG_10571 [Thecamonas trahens ATCC 50062]